MLLAARQCAGVQLVKVVTDRNVSQKMTVCKFALRHYRTLCALCCHVPPPPPIWRNERQSCRCRGWRRKTSWGRRRLLKGGNNFGLHQVRSCRVQTSLLFAAGAHVEVTRAYFCRSWQAESVDSGCCNNTAFTGACSESLCAEGVCITTGGRCDRAASKLATVKVNLGKGHHPATDGSAALGKDAFKCLLSQVEKATMTEGLFPEPVRVRPKERGGRLCHTSPFMRGSTIVRSQTFSPGARSQYVCRVSDCTSVKAVICRTAEG